MVCALVVGVTFAVSSVSAGEGSMLVKFSATAAIASGINVLPSIPPSASIAFHTAISDVSVAAVSEEPPKAV